MHILILGSTGRTGKHLLQQALQRGHSISILVRDKSKINVVDPRITIFEGLPLDKTALESSMKGCEAILSALNVSRNSDWPWSKLRSPADFMSETMKNIIELAPKQNINRIICTSAWGVAETKKEVPGWFRWFIDNSNVRYPYLDHERQEELLKRSSLQWTAVRLVGLNNFRKKKEVRVSLNNNVRPGLTISRREAAGFMLDVLENNTYIGQTPIISSR